MERTHVSPLPAWQRVACCAPQASNQALELEPIPVCRPVRELGPRRPHVPVDGPEHRLDLRVVVLVVASVRELPKQSHIVLIIYNLLGQEMATLVDEENPAGRYEVKWDASRFSSGVYFYRLQAGEFVGVKKLILTR